MFFYHQAAMKKNFTYDFLIQSVNEKRLRYFYLVMISGSMRQAAEILDIDQAGISRQIQVFEQELNIKLFERKGRNIIPTEAAYIVLDYFKEQMRCENALFHQLHELKQSRQQNVSVVSSEGFIYTLINQVLKPVNQQYADLSIRLELMDVNYIVRLVAEGKADLGLAYNPPLHPDVCILGQKNDPAILAVPFNHPLTKLKRAIRFEELSAFRFAVMPLGYGFRQIMDSELARTQTSLDIGLVTNSMSALKNYVAAGHGISILRAVDVHQELGSKHIQMLPLDSELCSQAQSQLLMRKHVTVSDSCRVLIRQIQTSFGLTAITDV